MGIPGIYKELGPGKRISLAKLSVEHLEKTGRKLRLAIDISIWQFQIQAGGGGRNPALRTLYYRLLKLLSLGICPLFVFDGPHKPRTKRNIESSADTACQDNYLTKQLLKKFEFPFHDAPGEAEAECALLQREGFVDAVLSEDVDTLMFGCTTSLRSWSPEGSRGGKSPTHVNIYTAEANASDAGLDSHGMVLVALMSGGDYNTNGVHGCGPRIACEVARAGFGRELGQLAKNDSNGWNEWRTRLQHELHTNESKHFKQKYRSINLPVDFPDQTVLGYYLRPVVSSSENLKHLKETLQWDMDIDTSQLRAFVAHAFNWPSLIGANRFIRTFAPALLAQKLLRRQQRDDFDDHDDLEAKAFAEAELIKSVHGSRTHWDTDGCVELRISYIPSNIVAVDLSLEDHSDQPSNPLVLHDDDVRDSAGEEGETTMSPSKSRGLSTYNPHGLNKLWMLETFVKLGTPLLVENWEEEIRNPQKFAARNVKQRAAPFKCHDKSFKGAMDRFVKITKPLPEQGKHNFTGTFQDSDALPPSPKRTTTAAPITTDFEVDEKRIRTERSKIRSKKPAVIKEIFSSTSATRTGEYKAIVPSVDVNTINPWTLSKRPSDTYGFKSPTRYSALGIYAPDDLENIEPRSKDASISTKATATRQGRALSGCYATTRPEAKLDCTASSQCDSSSHDFMQQQNNITYRTPRRLDRAKLSPRKRKPGARTCGGDDPSKPPSTSSGIHEETQLISLDSDVDEAMKLSSTTAQANRKLAFPEPAKQPQENSQESPSSNKSSLPSPSLLSCPRERKELAVSIPPIQKENQGMKSSHKFKAGRGEHAIVSLRESLEGAWKHILPSQAYSARDIFTNVEVLDLTNLEKNVE